MIAAVTPIAYPHTPTVDHIDVRFGIRIRDPYRRLEDADDPKTTAWLQEQRRLTEKTLNGPLRDEVRDRLRRLLDYEKPSPPAGRGGRVFTLWNSGLLEQPMLCLLRNGEPVPLADPNQWSPDGTTSINGFVPSPDGSRVAYGVSVRGSDWTEWRIVDVDSGATLDDRLTRIRFSSPSWTVDGTGLFYAAFGSDDVARIHLHTLGEQEDRLVYERPDRPWWRFQPQATDDGRWLIIYLVDQTGGPNGICIIDLETGQTRDVPDSFEGWLAYCGNEGSSFWFATDIGAPRGRLLSLDLAAAKREWRDVLPEHEDTLQWAAPKGERFIAGYLSHAKAVVRRFLMDGTPDGEVTLPGAGLVTPFTGSRHDLHTPFLMTSFTQPPSLLVYDAGRNLCRPVRQPQRGQGTFVTRQEFYESIDGTTVPIFLTHAREDARTKDVPVLMWGYGGFGIPAGPWYWPLAIAWIERGGMFALPSIRGGGEYGTSWHEAGSGVNKQNSFDDFIAAAMWLIDKGFTSTKRLAISGSSNGGLLVGACITQRPELFAAAHIDMGLLDMLHLDRARAGLGMVAEFGSMDDPEDVRRLHGYSPLHNVRAGVRYPATLLTTGVNDELVPPGNSYKFAAAMQAATSGEAPILLRADHNVGHGAGKPTGKLLDEQGDVLAFLLANTSR